MPGKPPVGGANAGYEAPCTKPRDDQRLGVEGYALAKEVT